MPIQLSQKEQSLLMDQKTHEETCVDKYAKYANQAQDPQLKQLFNTYSAKEQEHLNSINQLLSGQVPNVGGQQNQGQNQQQAAAQSQVPSNVQGNYNQEDAKLCKDMLMTEKYVSGAYDTAVFEFRDTNVRQVLNHIQKEEQQHGEGIFQYMQSHGMYQVQ
ncbi:coat F domain-containing protein [Desulfosporosinus orientis DSM 765]|uniref:Coat F domain-containing protein n=1 Tax=Desulfosporosinus orientis (strain ATCC 19365 / DSM 765 / NCIMB 8382 / VKM B-1628 / Singapore I) TaxID=768706 RepID=G7WAV3_DESOD|nr:spore coat protein [Desulfosporosinus orientis]AET67164.1 coat F domain-containing protein [Desulfosporosinus orientis DSM 765]